MISGLDHVTINTGNLRATERFYVEVVGLERAPRPELPIPGIWLKGLAPGGAAIVHVIEITGRVTSDFQRRSTVDHIAFHAEDFEAARMRVEQLDLPWCGNVIADFGLWQLMFYDPNGVLIELNFKADAESCETPIIPEENRFTLDSFFDPEAYEAF